MRLAIVTHAERPELAESISDLRPEFVRHDPVVRTFWPRLYDIYPDFQLWARDHETRKTVGYACSLPVRWDGVSEPRGVDWAMSSGTAGEPTALCSVVVAVVPEYRGTGVSGAILDRLIDVAAAHGLEALVAPVRPTWKERYPLTPIESYVKWRRGDGLAYDPWLRTHERLGGEVLDPAPRSLGVAGSREDWQEWTGMVFPEEGDYVVPGALQPVRFKDGQGTYVEPGVWVRHSTA